MFRVLGMYQFDKSKKTINFGCKCSFFGSKEAKHQSMTCDVRAKSNLVKCKFGKMCNVRACGSFLGVGSGIAISQFSLLSLNRSGPDSLSSKVALKIRNLT